MLFRSGYMSHDEGYLRFFVYISFFTTSMLGLVTSSNLIQIYFLKIILALDNFCAIVTLFFRPEDAPSTPEDAPVVFCSTFRELPGATGIASIGARIQKLEFCWKKDRQDTIQYFGINNSRKIYRSSYIVR